MPVYNGQKYLRVAIESILSQSYQDFELLIINDGSSDDSPEIINSYSDSRIRVVTNGKNLGLIATLNEGLDLASGEYIARMDCDDISLPDRLHVEMKFLARHPEIGFCGSWYERLRETGRDIVSMPVEDAENRFMLMFDNTFLHSSVILRKCLLDEHSLRFDSGVPHAEDYDFWIRCSKYTKMANIPEVLVRYRQHGENVSIKHRASQISSANLVRAGYLKSLDIPLNDIDLKLHDAIAMLIYEGDRNLLETAGRNLQRMADFGIRHWDLDERLVWRYLSVYWYSACGRCSNPGIGEWRIFRSYPFGRSAPLRLQAKLWLRCLLGRQIT